MVILDGVHRWIQLDRIFRRDEFYCAHHREDITVRWTWTPQRVWSMLHQRGGGSLDSGGGKLGGRLGWCSGQQVVAGVV